MTNRPKSQIIHIVIIFILFSINGCEKATDSSDEDLDLSQITETGTGPSDFIGTIDASDWSPSSYSSVVFGSSFWIQKPSSGDTLYFGGRSSGDSASQSLKIYNWGSTDLSINLQVSSPFHTTMNSMIIHPSTLQSVSIYFILPDTSSMVYNGSLVLKYSALDSMIFMLKGYYISSGSGGGSVLPVSFSLSPPYPNPTDGQITFSFTVPHSIVALLKVVNNKNNTVAVIAQRNFTSGAQSISWNAYMPNGNYRVIFESSDYNSQGDIRVLK
jgi:hypothetical protein